MPKPSPASPAPSPKRKPVTTREIQLAEALLREGLTYRQMAQHPGFTPGRTPASIRGIIQNHLAHVRTELARPGGLSPLSPTEKQWVNRNLPRWLDLGMSQTEICRRVRATTGKALTSQAIHYWTTRLRAGKLPCPLQRKNPTAKETAQ